MTQSSNVKLPVRRLSRASARNMAWRRDVRRLQPRPGDGPDAPSGEAPSRDAIRLTPRQIECLGWAADGKSSLDIADILGISRATVDEYIADACNRLGVRTRIQAIVEAMRRRWIA